MLEVLLQCVLLFFPPPKEIQKDEELTISYVDRSLNVDEREARLQMHRFVCTCTTCIMERCVFFSFVPVHITILCSPYKRGETKTKEPDQSLFDLETISPCGGHCELSRFFSTDCILCRISWSFNRRSHCQNRNCHSIETSCHRYFTFFLVSIITLVLTTIQIPVRKWRIPQTTIQPPRKTTKNIKVFATTTTPTQRPTIEIKRKRKKMIVSWKKMKCCLCKITL